MNCSNNFRILKSLVVCITMASSAIFGVSEIQAQKAWVPAENIGLLKEIHPSLKFHDLMPANFQLRIAAWDWYDENTIIFAHWDWNIGTIWLMEGAKSFDKSKVTYKRYYSKNIPEPLGIKRVNGKVYVAHKHAITELIDSNNDDVAESEKVLTTFTYSTWEKNPAGMHPNTFVYDLKYKDGYFYVGTGYTGEAGGFAYPAVRTESAIVKVNAITGEKEYIATGLRNPDGLAWGPEGELWCTTNQGSWNPSNKLVNVKNGGFYGQQYEPNGTEVETQPAVHIPFGNSSRSPTQPLLMSHGPYKGQFIIGDIFYGNVHRAYVEKVGGEYQGAHFNFSAGQSAGIHRIIQDALGNLYFGGMGVRDGGGGTWIWNGKLYGMQAVTYTDQKAFEVHSVNSLKDGFMLNFTEPVGAASLTPDNFEVTHWHYEPARKYGGDPMGLKKLTVTQVSADPTSTQIRVKIQGLQAGKIVEIRFHKDFVSAGGKVPFTGEFRYTLNRISDRTDVVTLKGFSAGMNSDMGISKNGSVFNVDFGHPVTGTLSVVDLTGRMLLLREISNETNVKFDSPLVKAGVYVLKFTSGKENLSKPIFMGR